MSLDFNGYGSWNGEPADFFDESDRMRPETESVIWHTMYVGIGEITKDNVQEFWDRSCFVERLSRDGGTVPFFTREFLEKMIGLRTNVTRWTRTQFNRHWVDSFWEQRRA